MRKKIRKKPIEGVPTNLLFKMKKKESYNKNMTQKFSFLEGR